jgi:hypothetical protein
MFHVILDKQTNAYVSSGARNAIGVTPFLYLARFFASSLRAVEFLDACGFGDERAKRFKIEHFDQAAKQLNGEQQIHQQQPRPKIARGSA